MRKHAEIESAFAARSLLEGSAAFFLVGIGGAGMSALARMLKHRGYNVHGTDSTPSPETDRLISEGIPVRIGHSGEGISDKHAVLLTDAIDLSASPEVERAKQVGAPIFRRSQVLGWLLRDKKVVAVTGTHGKTTTTGMVGSALIEAGLDPLIVVGASVPDFGGPVVEGKGDWAVVEACEAYDSFHDLDPQVVLLTNLELDHIDFHGSWANLKASVQRFVESLPADGLLVYCGGDPGAREIGEGTSRPTRAYGAEDLEEMARVRALEQVRLSLPGSHNRLNAAGAVIAAAHAGASIEDAIRGVASFGGAERRLQVLQDEAITVIDDYAHHPTEISASLRAINDRYPYRRVVVVYQPHLYSRTEPLIKEFADALSVSDEIVLTDIYPAREDPIPGVSSARIAELVTKPVHYIPNRHLLPRKVAEMVRPGDVVVGMGAGNIAEFAPALIEEMRRDNAAGFGPAAVDREGSAYKIAVIYGGNSAEREVSLLSGREVHTALKRKGYDSKLVDVAEILIKTGDLGQFIGPDRPDVAFLAVHGSFDEGGGLQGLFEMLHIPYTGSGLVASAVAMDKELAKRLLRSAGIRVPEGSLVTSSEDEVSIKGPWVVKPNSLGSTVGLSFVRSREELKPAIAKALQYDGSALVEEWILGMETSTPVLGDRPLPTVEIAPKSGVYDFANKYTPGATDEIVPARLPEDILRRCGEIALAAHRALGCSGATRTDMMIRDTEIVTLEVNTLPGMTATSLLPNSARAAGLEFDDLVVWLVEDALNRYARKA